MYDFLCDVFHFLVPLPTNLVCLTFLCPPGKNEDIHWMEEPVRWDCIYCWLWSDALWWQTEGTYTLIWTSNHSGRSDIANINTALTEVMGHKTCWNIFTEFSNWNWDFFSWTRNSLLLWNLKVHHHAHRSPQLDPILNQLNPTHTFTTCFLKVHLCLHLQSGSLPWDFATKILYAFIITPINTFPIHLIPWFNL